MSFEGYRQLLCKNGHVSYVDAYTNTPFSCQTCQNNFIWENLVDETNGMCYMICDNPRSAALSGICDTCTDRIDGYVHLEVNTPAVVKRCNLGHDHTTEPTRYKIPTDKGRLI